MSFFFIILGYALFTMHLRKKRPSEKKQNDPHGGRDPQFANHWATWFPFYSVHVGNRLATLPAVVQLSGFCGTGRHPKSGRVAQVRRQRARDL